MVATPLPRPDVIDLITLDIFSNVTGEIDGDKLQRVLLYIQASAPNLLTDGLLTGNPGAPVNVDYLALLRALAQKADQSFVVSELAGKEPKFTGLAAADLDPDKATYANLLLYALLVKVVNAIGSGSALPTRNIDEVPTAKALAVIAANASRVEETDSSYDGKSFFDDRNPNAIIKYECRKSRKLNPADPQKFYWYRSAVI